MNYDNDKYISFLDEIKEEKEESLNLNSRVLIIDGLNTFIRSHSVNPSLNDNGVHVGGLIGFLKSIRYSISLHKPTRCIIVFDGKHSVKSRRKIFPDYKQNRTIKKRLNRNVDWGVAPTDERESMRIQMGRLLQYLEHLPITLICIDNIEADDAISYITNTILPKDSKIFIMSTDKDFLQLVNNNVYVWSPTKKILYTEEKVMEEYGMTPNNFLLFRVMDGDKSDNIPGIKGAGIKTVIKNLPMLTESESLDIEKLIEITDKSTLNSKFMDTMRNNKEILYRNYLLMQLNDVDIPNHIKLKIQESVSREIPSLVKPKFQVMFLKDKLHSQILNLDAWITEFLTLDRFRRIA